MSRAAKKAQPKVGKAEAAATAHDRKVTEIRSQVTRLARSLFELHEDSTFSYSADLGKALRLAFDLGPPTAKLAEDTARRIESAKWQDRQPDLPLEDDDDE